MSIENACQIYEGITQKMSAEILEKNAGRITEEILQYISGRLSRRNP